jgi:hypothetical protein
MLSYSFVANASQDIKPINPLCKNDVLFFGKEISDAAKYHLSNVNRDYISSGLSLRKLLIDEGAIASQKYLDSALNIKIVNLLKKKELKEKDVSFLKHVREELLTHPLLIDESLSKELKDMFLNLM